MERFLAPLFLFITGSGLIFGQVAPPTVTEKLVVEATKSETPLSEIDHLAMVITAEEIARHQWKSLADVLVHLPGFSLIRNGGDGALTTVYARGSNTENTLVLWNGVKLSDASSPSRRFDYGHLSTNGIERIELLPGTQSTLYGSAASAGVINIVTKRGDLKPEIQASLEGGTGDSLRISAGVSGAQGAFRYSIQLEDQQSQSISAGFDPRSQTRPEEKDGYRNTNGNARLSWLREHWEAGVELGYLHGDLDLDKFPFNFDTFAQDFADDPNLTSEYEQRMARLFFSSRHLEGRWQQTLSLGRSQTQRNDEDLADAFTDFPFTSAFEAVNSQAEWRHNLVLSPRWHFTFGLEHEREKSEDQGSEADTGSLFGQARFQSERGLGISAGIRRDDHSDFGEATTFKLSPIYRWEKSGTRVFGSWGTGFNAPSLFQLNDGSFGNPTLREEESESWEAGIGQDLWGGKLQAQATYYETSYENLIDFVFDQATGSFGYANQPQAEMAGIEARLEYRHERLGLRLTHENLFKARNRGSATAPWLDLVRRSGDKWGLLAHYSFPWGFELNGELLRYGESTDFDFFDSAAPIVVLDSYLLVNLGASLDLGERFTLSLRGENLLDEEYTQVVGFQVYGARAFLGIRVQL